MCRNELFTPDTAENGVLERSNRRFSRPDNHLLHTSRSAHNHVHPEAVSSAHTVRAASPYERERRT